MEVMVLHRLSKVRMPKNIEADTVAQSRRDYSNDRARGQAVLLEAQGHYNASYKFRKDRERNVKYHYGDQLSDIVHLPDGRSMTEEKYLMEQGSIPLQTNLIRRLTKNVIGTFRQQLTEPICHARDRNEQRIAETLSTLLQYNMQLNSMDEMYARTMEENLISGLPIMKKSYGWRNERQDCWTDYINPNNFIPDMNMKDFRTWDCSFVGEIHDVSFGDVCKLAKNPSDYERLAKIYAEARQVRSGEMSWRDFGYGEDMINTDFLMPRDPSRCRVIEVWKKESKPRYRCHDWNSGDMFKIDPEDYGVMVKAENARRMEQAERAGIPLSEVPFITAEWFMDYYWYYYFLSPMGDILAEGETPYAHKSHPYVFKPFPFIDGKICSFVADVIPQQRYVNRMYILNDMVIRSSAKGLLLVPRGCVGTLSEEELGRRWASPNGVLVIDADPKTGKLPEQIAMNATNIGIHEMLQMQLKMFEDVSGVNGALQGKAAFSGESGSHAQMMAQNAATSLIDILESFQEFEKQAAYKDIKNIQQYYDEKKVLSIVGDVAKGYKVDPRKVLTTDVDISITPSQKTPVHRALANEFYKFLFEQKAIGIEQLLESVSDIPYADELLQSLRSQREAIEQGAPGSAIQGVEPGLVQAMQQKLDANPEAVAQLQQAVA